MSLVGEYGTVAQWNARVSKEVLVKRFIPQYAIKSIYKVK